jgi:chemotaxis protein MotB
VAATTRNGGAWKIAFADFMTAMMAFFLVMWLISASDKTKAVIAHYFNPVQLVDSTPQPKGMQDLKADAASVMKYANGQTRDSPTEKGTASADSKMPIETNASAENRNSEPDKSAKHEADLFRDPYAVLAEIAAKNDAQPKVSKKASTDGSKGGAGAIGLKGGDAYRDPFEPVQPPPGQPSAGDATLAKAAADAIALPPADPVESADPAKAAEAAKPTDVKPETAKAEAAKSDAAKPGAPPAGPSETPQQKAETAALAARIEAAASAQAADRKGAAEPKVEVHRTAEGLVVGLTDDASFSMFASASAEPSPQLVALMARIGRVLKAEKGAVTVRGFTDNRPFKSDTYDNWRLSTARADMAHYMLVRGGLDDSRIERIEGYADRRPKSPKNPGAPENRRIEILLREAPPQ